MKTMQRFIVLAVLCILLAVFSLTAFAQDCEALAKLMLPQTKITSAQIVAAGEFTPPRTGGPGGGGGGQGANVMKALPAFCRVVGVIEPAIKFEVWLPPVAGDKKWNGKFNGVGNGGLAGFIAYPAMAQAMLRGYATASTDTGHSNAPGNEAWALNHPELMVDFASRGIHLTARAAKSVIRAYYNQSPRYSYFTGCSGGGGQALSEAQRYPADYDGIVAGAPANHPTRMWPGELYAAYVTHRAPENLIPNEKLPMIARAALAACDAQDGLKDGLIADPRRCAFDPVALQCKGADAADCLTTGQVDSVRKIYEGLKDPVTGKLFWWGYEPSSEEGWPGHIQNPFGVPIGYFKYMAFNNPAWDWKTFDMADPKNFAALVAASNLLGPILNSIEPDLTAFQRLGGKLILYHGWLDQNISPRNSIQYYESVEEVMGEQTRDFARLFMAPGMGHCGGGPGPNMLDGLTALENWVEKKQAPQQIFASHATNGQVDRTRPLCPYPQVAVYKGSGSIDDAANFACQIPTQK
jgi:feruloyl esterase